MSSKKRTSLDALFPQETVAAPSAADSPPPGAGEGPPPASAAAEDVPAPPPVALGRRSSLYLPEPVYQQLRRLAFEEAVKMHTLFLEGIDRVLKDRGLPSISELTGRGRGA